MYGDEYGNTHGDQPHGDCGNPNREVIYENGVEEEIKSRKKRKGHRVQFSGASFAKRFYSWKFQPMEYELASAEKG